MAAYLYSHYYYYIIIIIINIIIIIIAIIFLVCYFLHRTSQLTGYNLYFFGAGGGSPGHKYPDWDFSETSSVLPDN
jgi:hypothetical protein